MFSSLIVEGLHLRSSDRQIEALGPDEEFQESRVHYTLAGIKSLVKIGEGGSLRQEGGSGTPGTLPRLRPCDDPYGLYRS